MKKFLSLLLVAVLALSMVACGTNQDPTTEPTTKPTTTPTTEPTTEPVDPGFTNTDPTGDDAATESKEIYLLNVSLGNQYIYITNDTEYGMYTVDMNTDVHKKGDFDPAMMPSFVAALENSGLMELIGTAEYGEGENFDTLYICYADYTSADIAFSGVEPTEAFTNGFAAFASEVATLLADMPEYVPQVTVDTFSGEIDADLLAELQTIANNANHPNLDSLAISNIPVDEYFAYSAGLTSEEGISTGAICQNQMFGGAVFNIVAVKAEDTAAVAADFEANLNWGKWVCVRPANALIATKGDMVLCFMADGALYADAKAAMVDAGWTIGNELTDPGF